MSLYTKTLLIITTILIALITLLYFVSQGILMDSFNNLEEQDVSRNVQRVLNAFEQNINQLNIQNGDYAEWDDTYQFVQDRNQAYIDSNLVAETFTSLGIDFMAFINDANEVVYTKAVNSQTGEVNPIPPELAALFIPQSPLLNMPEDSNGQSGIIMLGDKPALISSRHIFTSLMEGSSSGKLIMGYMLDEASIATLSDTLKLSLTLWYVGDPALPSSFNNAQSEIQTDSAIYVHPLSEQRTAGYALLNDLNGTPALILQVDLQRSIYAQGQASISFFLAALLIIGLIFTLGALILLDRLVLSRLTRLSNTLSAVRASADFSRRMPVDGYDELASLAADINSTLEALAQSQNDLQTANEQLEARVQERTLELSTTNLHLAEEIVQHQQTQAKLAGARDQAIEALNLKTQLLANISHDSRTPLTVIMLRTEMLKNTRYGAVNEKQMETLDSILVNGRQLLGFLNNLLSESQARAKTMRLKSALFNPADLLKYVSLTVAPLIERKRLTFTSEMDGDVPQTLLGDRERLNQILMNLVENAVKFTETGGIRIRIFQPDASHWSLQVSDTGIGIPQEAQAHIFDAFWQVDGSHVGEVNQGIGLGLSIVEQLTTLMKGEITVNSEPGHGTTFTITLPLLLPEKEQSDEKLIYSDR
jgi:signal transduction histidine kinase